MPARSERKSSSDAVQTVTASEHAQNKLGEGHDDERTSSRQRSRSTNSTSSTSSSSSTSTSGSGTSSETVDSDSSDSGSSSSASGGSDRGSRDTIPAVPSQKNSNEDDIQRRKRSPSCTRHAVDSGNRRPSTSPVKPEIETKRTSGLEVADIVCLSPSKIEGPSKEVCRVMPVEMTSGVSENGRRDRIRIVLGGKLFPVPVNQLCTSDSLRSITVYSDDEVDCNDDGRSLDRPVTRRITSEHTGQFRHQDSSKHPTEPHRSGKVEVVQSKIDSVSTAVNSNEKETNDDRKTKTAVSVSEIQDIRQNATNVDDSSRSPERQRVLADRRPGQASSRDSRHRHSPSERKSRSPNVGYGHRRSSRQSSTSTAVRRNRTEYSDGNIVSVHRGVTSRQITSAERYTDNSLRHEPTRIGRRNEVNRSRSKDRKDSRSRSPIRHNRDETGSSSRSRTTDHRWARAEVDERQRRLSKHDVTSVSGRRVDRQTSSRARSDVGSRYWSHERVKEQSYNVVIPTVPQYSSRAGYNERSD